MQTRKKMNINTFSLSLTKYFHNGCLHRSSINSKNLKNNGVCDSYFMYKKNLLWLIRKEC